jgi:hypothetical protein
VPFFLVGTRKLLVLTVVTFGLYELYWFYMHWRRQQQVGQEDVWPVVRALFAGFFSYSLFQRVNDEADTQGAPSLFSPVLLAVLYFVGLSCSRLGAPLWVTIAVTLVPLALTQSIVNGLPQVTALPSGMRNERLSKKNWAGLAGFAFVSVLLLLPEPAPATAGRVAVDTLVASASADLPRTMTGGVVLERIETVPDGVRLYVLLQNVKDGKEGEIDAVAKVRRSLLESACTSASVERTVLEGGHTVHYVLNSSTRTRIATMAVTTLAQCAALAQ